MAMDTREERQSAYGFLLRFFSPGVAPSPIDAAERQAAAYTYAGILAAPPLAVRPPLLAAIALSPVLQMTLITRPALDLALTAQPVLQATVTTYPELVGTIAVQPAIQAEIDLNGEDL